MFYKKPLILKKTKNIKLRISNFSSGINCDTDESNLPINVAKMSYNFNSSNGALRSGLGFKELSLLDSEESSTEHNLTFVDAPTEINKVWLYPYFNTISKEEDNILLISADNKLYFCELVSQVPVIYEILNEITFTSIPNAIYYNLDGEDVMLVTSETDGMLVYSPQYINSLLTNAPKIISMCKHYDRLFAIKVDDRKKLVYSDNLDPTNWTSAETKFIDLSDTNGALIKVVAFNDYVYVFKEFGIIKISAYSTSGEFSITDLYVSGSKIYGNSVCLCGDKIVFLAKDGLYSFNGYTVSKIKTNVEDLFRNLNNENCASAYFKGKYYISLKVDFNDNETIGCENYSAGFINNVLLEYDLRTNNLQIVRGVDIKSMCAIEYGKTSKLIFAFNGEYKSSLAELTNNGKLFSSNLKKSWISAYTNLDLPNKTKKVKAINLVTKGACSVLVRTDKFKKEYDVNGASKTTTIYPNIYGEMFQIGFTSEDNVVNISNAEIEVSLTN